MVAVVFSRLLGLVRVILEAKVLGGGVLATAWQMAFAIPNLFRRIFGEGALGAALIPMLSDSLVTDGKDRARRMLTMVLGACAVVLGILSLLIAIGALVAVHFFVREDIVMTLKLIPMMMPYAIFICMIGIISAALNCLRVFFLPALGSLLMNIFIIACLYWVCPRYQHDNLQMLRMLGHALLWSGVVQLLMMFWLLHRHQIFPEFSRSALNAWEVLQELWRLTLPGVLAASAVQISFLVDRSLAIYLGPYAVPALTNCDRIVFLPIGLFAISLGSVVLPRMSKAAARENDEDLIETMLFGLRHLMFMCIPMTVFMVVFRIEILRLILLRGNFDEQALRETAWTMLFYASGIPFFSSIKILVSAFQARKDMKTPMKVSLFCIVANLVMNLILMWPLKQGGIAMATVISSLCNNMMLLILLQRVLRRRVPLEGVIVISLRSLLLSAVIGGTLMYFYNDISRWCGVRWHLPVDLLPLSICATAFGGIYFLMERLTGSREARDLLELLPFRRQ